MSDADGAVTLDEFVATAGRWSDKLPENIKAQIMASNAGALKISKWLNQIGYRDATAKDHAIDLGLAMQLTNIARDVQEDLGFDRIYLPQDEMARFGYSEAELTAGIVNEPFKNLMRFQAQRARSYFHSGFQLLPYLSPRSRACPAVLGQLYSKVLQHIESAGYDVLHQRISLSRVEKLRVTAQTWLTSMLPQSPK